MTRPQHKPAPQNAGAAPPQEGRQRPAHEVRLGRITGAIWLNENEEGRWFNVTFSRLYKDSKGAWTSTGSFGRDDLLVLAKVADLCHTWVCEQLQADQPDHAERERR